MSIKEPGSAGRLAQLARTVYWTVSLSPACAGSVQAPLLGLWPHAPARVSLQSAPEDAPGPGGGGGGAGCRPRVRTTVLTRTRSAAQQAGRAARRSRARGRMAAGGGRGRQGGGRWPGGAAGGELRRAVDV